VLVRDRKPLMIEDAAASDLVEYEYLQRFDIRSLLIVPLMTRGEIVGAMLVDQGTRPRRFSAHEIDVVMGIANQAAVAIESARLVQTAEEKKRLEYELGLAQQIQASFLPDACPTVPGYDICSQWQAARVVSGDFYDFIPLRDGRLGITIADVSDKGIAAALFMALSRTILRTMAIGKPTARETVERANDVIIADARAEMFVTVIYGILDSRQHRLTYVNAGHNPPLVYRAKTKQVTTLDAHGIALGVMPDVSFSESEIELAPGDVVLLYTDGVTEAIDTQQEQFGMERLAEIVAAYADDGPTAITNKVMQALTDFAGEGVQFDDVTMVALKRLSR
jgi:sigma-B regulation protein RsbU (phosphoserine phosphatase)